MLASQCASSVCFDAELSYLLTSWLLCTSRCFISCSIARYQACQVHLCHSGGKSVCSWAKGLWRLLLGGGLRASPTKAYTMLCSLQSRGQGVLRTPCGLSWGVSWKPVERWVVFHPKPWSVTARIYYIDWPWMHTIEIDDTFLTASTSCWEVILQHTCSFSACRLSTNQV